MLNINVTTLAAVVDRALKDAADHPRWLHAIDRAVVELIDNPYLERQDGHLLIASPSGQIYSSNGICQCKAFEFGQPCWHRAAARLVRLHDEALAKLETDRDQCPNCCADRAYADRCPAAQIDADQAARWAAAQAGINECFGLTGAD